MKPKMHYRGQSPREMNLLPHGSMFVSIQLLPVESYDEQGRSRTFHPRPEYISVASIDDAKNMVEVLKRAPSRSCDICVRIYTQSKGMVMLPLTELSHLIAIMEEITQPNDQRAVAAVFKTVGNDDNDD